MTAQSFETQFQQALAAARAGRRAEALVMLQQLVRQYPKNPRAWYLLSQVVEEKDRQVYCLEKVLELDPQNPQATGQLNKLKSTGPQLKPQTRRRKSWPWIAGAMALLVVCSVGGVFALFSIYTGVQQAQADIQAAILTIPPEPTYAVSRYTPAVRAPTVTVIPTLNRGKWIVHRDTSSFDDSPIIVASLKAEKPVTGWLDTYIPELLIRCRERKLDVYIDVGMSQDVESGNLDHSTVRLRFDDEAPFTTNTGHSTDGEALFFEMKLDMYHKILGHERLLFSFVPFNANPVETWFDLRGIKELVQPAIESACPPGN